MEAKNIIELDSTALVKTFSRIFWERFRDKKQISVALSGGSTPKVLFQYWANAFKQEIDWSRIHFFWGDERCVPPDHQESNYRMTKELLLSQIDIPESNIHRIRGEAAPEAESLRYAEEIKQYVPLIDGWPCFDCIILGIGTDGHTASIFPDQMHLLESDSICAVAVHPDSGQKRISLTGRVLNAAANVSFLVTGASKFEVLDQIRSQKGNWNQYPASYIQPKGRLEFFLDEAAAG